MKKLYIIAAVLPALAGVSCNRLVEYTDIPFVYFPNPTVSIYEDAGIIDIPVKASSDVEFTLTFETVDGEKTDPATGVKVPNGQRGVDYDIVDNDAALVRFASGETEKSIQVKITDFPGVLTGNKDFTIKMVSSGNEVSRGGYSYCTVTIIDNDHPLKSILGEYTATDAEGQVWTMTLAADPNDWYTTFIDGIVPAFAGNWVGKGLRHYVPAKVSEDLSQFSFNYIYKLADQYNGDDVTIWGIQGGSSIYNSGTATFEKTSDGFKLDGERGLVAITEKNGSYYLAAQNGIANAPITLVKKVK
ncbi:MAG: hypothetical protein IKH11_07835 [Bacteroidales bacterium]|nr:hypothetical protein [Bacteroidales bacterium]